MSIREQPLKDLVGEFCKIDSPANPVIKDLSEWYLDLLLKARGGFGIKTSAYIEGEYGSGKTSMCVALAAKYLPEKQIIPIYIDIHDLLMKNRHNQNFSLETVPNLPLRELIKAHRSLNHDWILPFEESLKKLAVKVSDTPLLADKILKIRYKVENIIDKTCQEEELTLPKSIVILLDEFERPLIRPQTYSFDDREQYLEHFFDLVEKITSDAVFFLTKRVLELYNEKLQTMDIDRQMEGRIGSMRKIEYYEVDIRTFIENTSNVYGWTIAPIAQIARLKLHPRAIRNLVTQLQSNGRLEMDIWHEYIFKPLPYLYEIIDEALNSQREYIYRQEDRRPRRPPVTPQRKETMTYIIHELLIRGTKVLDPFTVSEFVEKFRTIVNLVDSEKYARIFRAANLLDCAHSCLLDREDIPFDRLDDRFDSLQSMGALEKLTSETYQLAQNFAWEIVSRLISKLPETSYVSIFGVQQARETLQRLMGQS